MSRILEVFDNLYKRNSIVFPLWEIVAETAVQVRLLVGEGQTIANLRIASGDFIQGIMQTLRPSAFTTTQVKYI
jgi:hypothetical protein